MYFDPRDRKVGVVPTILRLIDRAMRRDTSIRNTASVSTTRASNYVYAGDDEEVEYDHGLGTHTDVVLTTPATNEVLVFNGSAWVNASGATTFIGLADTPADYGTAGQVPKSNGVDALVWSSIDWSELSGVPSTFPPTAHDHNHNDLLGIQGGTAPDQYYHLNYDQAEKLLTNVDASIYHHHDGRYYTETEVDNALAALTFTGLTDTPAGYGTTGQVAMTNGVDTVLWAFVQWSQLQGVPSTFPPSSHTHAHNDTTSKQGGTSGQYYHLTSAQHSGLTGGSATTLHHHDSRYYTETEIDSMLITTLSGLTDTTIGTLTTGEVLTWNGTAWVNAAASGGSSYWQRPGAYVQPDTATDGVYIFESGSTFVWNGAAKLQIAADALYAIWARSNDTHAGVFQNYATNKAAVWGANYGTSDGVYGQRSTHINGAWGGRFDTLYHSVWHDGEVSDHPLSGTTAWTAPGADKVRTARYKHPNYTTAAYEFATEYAQDEEQHVYDMGVPFHSHTTPHELVDSYDTYGDELGIGRASYNGVSHSNADGSNFHTFRQTVVDWLAWVGKPLLPTPMSWVVPKAGVVTRYEPANGNTTCYAEVQQHFRTNDPVSDFGNMGCTFLSTAPWRGNRFILEAKVRVVPHGTVHPASDLWDSVHFLVRCNDNSWHEPTGQRTNFYSSLLPSASWVVLRQEYVITQTPGAADGLHYGLRFNRRNDIGVSRYSPLLQVDIQVEWIHLEQYTETWELPFNSHSGGA